MGTRPNVLTTPVKCVCAVWRDTQALQIVSVSQDEELDLGVNGRGQLAETFDLEAENCENKCVRRPSRESIRHRNTKAAGRARVHRGEHPVWAQSKGDSELWTQTAPHRSCWCWTQAVSQPIRNRAGTDLGANECCAAEVQEKLLRTLS